MNFFKVVDIERHQSWKINTTGRVICMWQEKYNPTDSSWNDGIFWLVGLIKRTVVGQKLF